MDVLDCGTVFGGPSRSVESVDGAGSGKNGCVLRSWSPASEGSTANGPATHRVCACGENVGWTDTGSGIVVRGGFGARGGRQDEGGCSERGSKDSGEVDKIAPDGEPACTAAEWQSEGELYWGRGKGKERRESSEGGSIAAEEEVACTVTEWGFIDE